MKIHVPIINNGSGDVKAGWAMSMITELSGADVCIQSISDSHANRAMNKAACEFLKTDCDAMLVIDADITFTKRDIANLLSHKDAKLVYGIYPKKSDAAEPCLCTFAEVPVPDENGLATVRRAGRGFMLVKRELLEAMKEDNGGPALRYHNHEEVQWDFFPSGPVTGDHSALSGTDKDGYPLREWISEDWFFCERARALGAATVVDTRIALGHIGPKEFRFGGEQLARMDSNIDTWKDVHGWFDYEELYRTFAEKIPDGGTFVEVGSWLGRSLAAFDAFAKESGKNITLHAVDTFQGKPANETHRALLDAHGGSVQAAFRANMKALGVNPFIHVGDSAAAASLFVDGSLHAVFIDASHDEKDVARDIAAWLPKIKSGGVIAGHDYDEEGVARAVNSAFASPLAFGRCWVVDVA